MSGRGASASRFGTDGSGPARSRSASGAQGIQPTAEDRAKPLPVGDRADALVSAQRLWTVRQMVYGELLRHLDEVFAKLGIPYMPVKGAYLICAGLAGRIAQRRMVDVDLLVLPCHFGATAQWFVEAPHTRERPGVWPFEREFYHQFAGRMLEIEIHRALNYEERFRLPPEELFRRGIVTGTMRVLPSPEDALLIAVAHALVHVVEGLDETRWNEYVLLASQTGFQWPIFWERATSAGIRAFAELLLHWAWDASAAGRTRPALRSVRARALAALVTPRVCNAMPSCLRRALVEAPFVRRPIGLAILGLRAWLSHG